VKRQIEGWSERYERALTPDAPQWAPVVAWLKAKMPDRSSQARHRS